MSKARKAPIAAPAAPVFILEDVLAAERAERRARIELAQQGVEWAVRWSFGAAAADIRAGRAVSEDLRELIAGRLENLYDMEFRVDGQLVDSTNPWRYSLARIQDALGFDRKGRGRRAAAERCPPFIQGFYDLKRFLLFQAAQLDGKNVEEATFEAADPDGPADPPAVSDSTVKRQLKRARVEYAIETPPLLPGKGQEKKK